jgi:hypothetical protein
MNWFYAKNGSQQGPVATEALKAMLASGEISPSDLIWRDGMSDWTPAGRVAEIASVAASPSMEAAPYTSPAPASYSAPTSYAAPSSYSPGQLPPPAGLAIASMCCGIASIVICCMPYFSIFAAIAAVVMGHITQKKIKANLAGGSGMKTAGLITGYIGLVIAVFMLGVMILAQFNPDFAKKLEEMQNKQKQKIESQQR